MALQTSVIPTATTLPASITSPPTVQFTPAADCYDPDNNWIVSTSCFITGSGVTDENPDWLTCTLKNFGPVREIVESCSIPFRTIEHRSGTDNTIAPQVTVDGVVSYYSGCPAGFTPFTTHSSPAWNTSAYSGHFDATGYIVNCCPTLYPFEDTDKIIPYTIYEHTTHDGTAYSLYYFQFPSCAATSIQVLSGKTLSYQTSSNPYRKRQVVDTELWDFEHGTLFAQDQAYEYTIFQGTHTCYENCDQWFTYYYPDGVGTPGPAWTTPTVVVTPPAESPSGLVPAGSTPPSETDGTSGPGTTSSSTAASTNESTAPNTTSAGATVVPPTGGAYRSSGALFLVALVVGLAGTMVL
ncbi:hypothetical protein F4777DRAFT_572107 [Nemania sp. FL0916]|nr:hypothetical protein F4777DRAFT_572107 [Nemania sp. FL0916]